MYNSHASMKLQVTCASYCVLFPLALIFTGTLHMIGAVCKIYLIIFFYFKNSKLQDIFFRESLNVLNVLHFLNCFFKSVILLK